MRLDRLGERLPEAVRALLERQRTRLDSVAELVAGRSPERILRLGFAVVRAGGRAVVSAAAVRPGDRLQIELADGRLEATAGSDTKSGAGCDAGPKSEIRPAIRSDSEN